MLADALLSAKATAANRRDHYAEQPPPSET